MRVSFFLLPEFLFVDASVSVLYIYGDGGDKGGRQSLLLYKCFDFLQRLQVRGVCTCARVREGEGGGACTVVCARVCMCVACAGRGGVCICTLSMLRNPLSPHSRRILGVTLGIKIVKRLWHVEVGVL